MQICRYVGASPAAGNSLLQLLDPENRANPQRWSYEQSFGTRRAMQVPDGKPTAYSVARLRQALRHPLVVGRPVQGRTRPNAWSPRARRHDRRRPPSVCFRSADPTPATQTASRNAFVPKVVKRVGTPEHHRTGEGYWTASPSKAVSYAISDGPTRLPGDVICRLLGVRMQDEAESASSALLAQALDRFLHGHGPTCQRHGTSRIRAGPVAAENTARHDRAAPRARQHYLMSTA